MRACVPLLVKPAVAPLLTLRQPLSVAAGDLLVLLLHDVDAVLALGLLSGCELLFEFVDFVAVFLDQRLVV